MNRWSFSISLLPLTNILIGFNYQVGEFTSSEDEEPVTRYFEEYSLGFLFISFTACKYIFK